MFQGWLEAGQHIVMDGRQFGSGLRKSNRGRHLPGLVKAGACLAVCCLVWSGAAGPGVAQWLDQSLDQSLAQQGRGSLSQGEDGSASSPQRVVLRFVTESNFPPFNFYDEDGVLTGFNVDLARAICLEVEMTCDIKVRDWNNLIPEVVAGRAEAAIAGHRITPQALEKVAFSDAYFRTPGRFAVRRDATAFEATPEGLQGRRIGVVTKSAHEAFVRRFFSSSSIASYQNVDDLREALKERAIDAIFDDGISLSFWLNGTLSQRCCQFRGGPFLEPKFFGDGIAIAVKKDDPLLRSQINEALDAVRVSGRLQELVARYFPFAIY